MSVLVFAENWDGQFKKGTFEAVTYAHETAQKLGTSTVAVTIGSLTDDASLLGNYGADKVVCLDNNIDACNNQALAAAIAEVASNEGATAVVISNSNTGKSISPRVAIKLGAAFISNVCEVASNSAPLTVKKKAFSGKAFENAQSNKDCCVLALAPNSFHINETGGSASVENASAAAGESKVTSTNIEKATGKISLAEAEIVVSAGRGLKGPENWGMVEDLAELLGAGTACSKPVSDIGWRSHDEHVGQTGKAVAPNLYIAIGISGAIQHLAGVNSSKVMVAINTDPEAPFFKAADYGIVGDAFEVVPRLIEEIRNFKANN
jgi:electron transfer flavoprotein alpha subunit